MRKIFKTSRLSTNILTMLVMVILILISAKCSKHTSPSAKEITQAQLTSGTWTLTNFTVDNVDMTSLYSGLTLSIGQGTYSTTNGKAPVWPASGTWAFSDDTSKNITRDGSLPVTIVQIDQHTLVLSMTWSATTNGGGRSESISGDYVFTFKK